MHHIITTMDAKGISTRADLDVSLLGVLALVDSQQQRLVWVRLAQPGHDLLVRGRQPLLPVHHQHQCVGFCNARSRLPLNGLCEGSAESGQSMHQYWQCALQAALNSNKTKRSVEVMQSRGSGGFAK